jgi:hypothetical protein
MEGGAGGPRVNVRIVWDGGDGIVGTPGALRTLRRSDLISLNQLQVKKLLARIQEAMDVEQPRGSSSSSSSSASSSSSSSSFYSFPIPPPSSSAAAAAAAAAGGGGSGEGNGSYGGSSGGAGRASGGRKRRGDDSEGSATSASTLQRLSRSRQAESNLDKQVLLAQLLSNTGYRSEARRLRETSRVLATDPTLNTSLMAKTGRNTLMFLCASGNLAGVQSLLASLNTTAQRAILSRVDSEGRSALRWACTSYTYVRNRLGITSNFLSFRSTHGWWGPRDFAISTYKKRFIKRGKPELGFYYTRHFSINRRYSLELKDRLLSIIKLLLSLGCDPNIGFQKDTAQNEYENPGGGEAEDEEEDVENEEEEEEGEEGQNGDMGEDEEDEDEDEEDEDEDEEDEDEHDELEKLKRRFFFQAKLPLALQRIGPIPNNYDVGEGQKAYEVMLPLEIAVAENDLEFVRLLLNRGAFTNVLPRKWGATNPLFLACSMCKNPRIVDLLIKSGSLLTYFPSRMRAPNWRESAMIMLGQSDIVFDENYLEILMLLVNELERRGELQREDTSNPNYNIFGMVFKNFTFGRRPEVPRVTRENLAIVKKIIIFLRSKGLSPVLNAEFDDEYQTHIESYMTQVKPSDRLQEFIDFMLSQGFPPPNPGAGGGDGEGGGAGGNSEEDE